MEMGRPRRAANRLFARLFDDEERGRRGRYASTLIRQLQRTLPPDDPARAIGFVLKCRLRGGVPEEWDIDEIATWLEAPALAHHREAELELMYFHALTHLHKKSEDEGLALLRDVARLAKAERFARIEGVALTSIGATAMARDEATAVSTLEAGLEKLRASSEHVMSAACHTYLGQLSNRAGDQQGYLDHFEQALDILKTNSLEKYIPRLLLERSAGLSRQGDFEAALTDAEEAWTRGIWSYRDMIGAIGGNYAACLAICGRHDHALEILDLATHLVGEQRLRAAQVRMGRLIVAAFSADTKTWDEMPQDPSAYFAPWYFELAAEQWEARGDDTRAANARTLAHAMSPSEDKR